MFTMIFTHFWNDCKNVIVYFCLKLLWYYIGVCNRILRWALLMIFSPLKQSHPPMKMSWQTVRSFFKSSKRQWGTTWPILTARASCCLKPTVISALKQHWQWIGPLSLVEGTQGSISNTVYAGEEEICIPATSSPSEREFSTGGNIITYLHPSLKPQNVDRLVFLAKNL